MFDEPGIAEPFGEDYRPSLAECLGEADALSLYLRHYGLQEAATLVGAAALSIAEALQTRKGARR